MKKLLSALLVALLVLQAFVEAELTHRGMGEEAGSLAKKPHSQKINCSHECSRRCRKASKKNRCHRACHSCCARCRCVPPGTYGNKNACPCYASLRTHGNRLKCP